MPAAGVGAALADPALADAVVVPVPARPPAGDPRFAHASEAEFARILDFYAVRWEYEPHTYPILWSIDGAVLESFAPDFYLPDLDLYVELTTLRQKLVRKKNRKLRRLRECYPDLRVKLFYARDFRALMLKYGKLALADALSGTVGQVVPSIPPTGAVPSDDAVRVDPPAPAAAPIPPAAAAPVVSPRRRRRRPTASPIVRTATPATATPATAVPATAAATSPATPTAPRHRHEAAAR